MTTGSDIGNFLIKMPLMIAALIKEFFWTVMISIPAFDDIRDQLRMANGMEKDSSLPRTAGRYRLFSILYIAILILFIVWGLTHPMHSFSLLSIAVLIFCVSSLRYSMSDEMQNHWPFGILMDITFSLLRSAMVGYVLMFLASAILGLFVS